MRIKAVLLLIALLLISGCEQKVDVEESSSETNAHEEAIREQLYAIFDAEMLVVKQGELFDIDMLVVETIGILTFDEDSMVDTSVAGEYVLRYKITSEEYPEIYIEGDIVVVVEED